MSHEPRDHAMDGGDTPGAAGRAVLSRAAVLAWIAGILAGAGAAASELRFPPPDFESGHELPVTQYPAAGPQWMEFLDVLALLVGLGLAVWLIFKRRSRRGVAALSLASLAYFGFFRNGCVCAIGSLQNVAYALGGHGYALPVGVGIFFAAPLLVALFFGRAFCAAVCPHGALQDLALVRPVTIPRWLESGLGVIPYFYLGAGVAFAATGAGFVICQWDPFVPLFRMSGSAGMVARGGALVAASMFIGRPYCRFLCPYGALLRVGATLSRRRVRITPDRCTQCRLCSAACPFGVIQAPDSGLATPAEFKRARRRVLAWVAAAPLLIAAGGGAGWVFGDAAARFHPTVKLARFYARAPEDTTSLLTAERLAVERVEREAAILLPRAAELKGRFKRAGLWFGLWAGFVTAVKLVSLGMIRRRTEYLPERGGCFACARCFEACPEERIRQGIAAPGSAPLRDPGVGVAETSEAAPVAAAAAGCCGCEGGRRCG
jgi:NosR/NirI family nitrous oxide reductase transcriptional regulator